MKVLGLVNVALMFLPQLRYRGTKYFHYFVVLALLDPIFLLLRYLFSITSFHYMPVAASLMLFALPVKDRKYVLLTIVSVILVLPHISEHNFLAPLTTVIISALIINYFFEQILFDYKNSHAIPLFLPLLILCTIVDSIKISLYYSNLPFLTKHYIWFLIFGLITTLLLFYFGAGKKLQLKAIPVLENDLKEEKNDDLEPLENLHIYKIDKNDPFYELTNAELRVLELLGEGYKSTEIAERLFISKKTVYFHCGKLKEKLTINSSRSLTKYSIENRHKFVKKHKTGKSASA
ncbi:MAG: LuxR C-terminal-related transcriptional regulator [Melioribacteraceae bacterium]